MTALRAAVYGRESQANVKSIDDQVAIGAGVVADQGWELAGTFDDGSSASRFARRARADWARLLDEIDAGRIDVVVVWELSRGSRKVGEWVTVLDHCRELGVRIHVVDHDRTYDPTRAADYKTLANGAVDAAYETDHLSERVRRGNGKAAEDGRPPGGAAPYGYWRRHEVEPGARRATVYQEPDPETAPVVARIVADVAAGKPLARIARDLDAAGVPAPARPNRSPGRWQARHVRGIAINPAYAGLRRHNGDEPTTAKWPAIVSAETFHAARRVLADNARKVREDGEVRRRVPGQQRHLLSFVATCHEGHPLAWAGGRYKCKPHGHGTVNAAALDELVEAVVVEMLATPEVYRRLRQAGDVTDAQAQRARDGLATLEARLADYRDRARRGRIDADDFADIAAGLKADITAARERADETGLPPALRPFTEPGADVEARWDAAPLAARREVIRALVTVTVRPAGRRGRTPVPVADRVDIEPAR